MKKLISLTLALVLSLLAVSALADLADLSLDELQEQAARIQAEIFSRAGNGFQLYPGEYIVGEDIPAGKYRVETVKSYGIVSIYKVNGLLYLSEFLNATDPDGVSILGKVALENGMTVEIESTVFRIVPYTGIQP